jgi:hypothetical protein
MAIASSSHWLMLIVNIRVYLNISFENTMCSLSWRLYVNRAAGCRWHSMEDVTMKKSELNRLACKWLPVVLLALKVANQFAELVSKVVNYASPFRKLQPLF